MAPSCTVEYARSRSIVPSTEPVSVVDDREDVRARRAEAEARRGVVAPGPDVAGLRLLQLGMLGRTPQGLGAEDLGVRLVERRLERGGRDVPVEDAWVLVVEDRGLDAASEQRLGLSHEVLVERVVARDEDGEPVARRPARPHCWRRLATVPGKPTEITAVEQRRRRCRARARSSR